MRIWFDTEFIEDGRTIELVSIGVVREDGNEYYAESSEVDLARSSDWVKAHVISHLQGKSALKSRLQIRDDLVRFTGDHPEFWAYYCAYDWVVLCQLFGTMMNLPPKWPKYCLDVKQLAEHLGNPRLPKKFSTQHHAMADAYWTRDAYRSLSSIHSARGRLSHY